MSKNCWRQHADTQRPHLPVFRRLMRASLSKVARSRRSPGFQACCIADFPPLRSAKAPLRHDGGLVGRVSESFQGTQVWRPAIQGPPKEFGAGWKSALLRFDDTGCELSRLSKIAR